MISSTSHVSINNKSMLYVVLVNSVGCLFFFSLYFCLHWYSHYVFNLYTLNFMYAYININTYMCVGRYIRARCMMHNYPMYQVIYVYILGMTMNIGEAKKSSFLICWLIPFLHSSLNSSINLNKTD